MYPLSKMIDTQDLMYLLVSKGPYVSNSVDKGHLVDEN